MGKPFGLLHRIFSFSRGSKRSGTNSDLLSPNEHGQQPDARDPDETLHFTGSVRTTGGIGGLGLGITNTASEMSRSSTGVTAQKGGGERGLRKRLLRRASLSASDLLSWGYERPTKHETRIASEGGAAGGGQKHHPVRRNDIKPHDKSSTLEQKYDSTHYNDRVVEGLALSNGDSKRGKRDQSLRTQDNEELTRLLRSSSSNYRVISETDYRDMTPLEHPINAIALSRSPSIPLLSSSTRSNTPTSWPSQRQPNTMAFPPQNVPRTLTHASSVTSTTSTSTYKVTIHRRRIHSRTSFPEANRALDHLHSSSPATANSTPSVSPRSSSDLPERVTCKSAPVKPSAIPKMRGQSHSPRAAEMPPPPKQQRNYAKEVPPSMLPRRSSKRQPLTQTIVQEENFVRRSVVVNSQVYPVAPLRTVPPTSRRSTSASLGNGALKVVEDMDQTDKPSIKLLCSRGGSSSRTNMIENAFRYKTPLKGSDISVVNEDAYDGVMQDDVDTVTLDPQASPAPSTLTKTSGKRTRNVLKKKKRESQASIAPTSDISAKAASVKSGKSMDCDESRSEKNGSRTSFRSVMGVLHAVEGVIERLHGSAVGEEALGSSRCHHVEGDIVLSNEIPSTRRLNISQSTPPPTCYKLYSSNRSNSRMARPPSHSSPVTSPNLSQLAPEAPCDQVRLAKLRRDASVVSLLDMYQADGTLKEGAFSNTPPSKPLQRAISEKMSRSARQPILSAKVKTETWNGPHEMEPESRSAQMRRVYVEALDDSSFEILQSKKSGPPIKPSITGFAGLNRQSSAQPPVTSVIHTISPDEPSSTSPNSVVEGRYRSRKVFVTPGDAVSSDSSAVDAGLEYASLSSEHETSGMLVDSSLFVEPGSRGYVNDTSCESTPAVEPPADTTKWPSYYMLEGDRPRMDRDDGISALEETILRSPNRRASEVFAFLDSALGVEGESFEAGTLSAKEEVPLISKKMTGGSQNSRPQGKSTYGVPLLTPISTPMFGSSPSKRPLGPRTATGFSLTHSSCTKERKTPPSGVPSDGASKSNRGCIPISSAPSPVPESPEPLTGATFASDSFASQNTTDRSLYRGIYKYLNETPSVAHRSKAKETTVRDSLIIVPQQSTPNEERNPFLTTPTNLDKSLPITPSPGSGSEVDSAAEWAKYTRDFMSLPISPVVPATDTSRGATESGVSPMPPSSPCKVKSSVKDRIAMWESTKPLEIDRSSIKRRPSSPKHLIPCGKSVRWSEDTSQSKKSGLGDGRAFNASLTSGRMHGPRAPSPAKKATTKPVSQLSQQPTIPRKNTKPTDFTHCYPFSQDLFPAILSPGGPAVARPNSLLQTPQRNAAHNDPSPASSSKLGVYGREIMALARSKSGARSSRDDGNPL